MGAVSRDHGGDVAPLKEILALKDEFGYRLILDESLSWGVLGATGRGLKEACGIEDPTSVEITCVDLAPALGSNGGLCIGTDEVVAHQRLSGAGYCFSPADDAAPALPPLKKKPLALRVTTTADHSEADVKGLVAALAKASAKASA